MVFWNTINTQLLIASVFGADIQCYFSGVSLAGLSTPINKVLLGDRFERDGNEMLARLGPIYLQTMPDLIDQLYEAYQSRNREKLRYAAHTLKGNASAISAEALADLLIELEAGAGSLGWQQVKWGIERISAENNRVINWLHTKL